MNDVFYWTVGDSNGTTAFRSDLSVTDSFTQNNYGPIYFVLDNAALPSGPTTQTSAVPEPASLALLGLGSLVMFAGNRRRRRR